MNKTDSDSTMKPPPTTFSRGFTNCHWCNKLWSKSVKILIVANSFIYGIDESSSNWQQLNLSLSVLLPPAVATDTIVPSSAHLHPLPAYVRRQARSQILKGDASMGAHRLFLLGCRGRERHAVFCRSNHICDRSDRRFPFAMHVRRSAFEIDQGVHDDSFIPCGHVPSCFESVYSLQPCQVFDGFNFLSL
jgi:hypothetical protein